MSDDFTPICTIIAGPNGGGKSTIIQELAPEGETVNADDYARRIHPQNVAAASALAGRAVLKRLGVLINNSQSFNYETTLSSHQSLKLIEIAKQAGFKVEMALVLLRFPEMHVARIKTRIANGGHDIPVKTILRRYERTLANIPKAIRTVDRTIIYDNSGDRPVLLSRLNGLIINYSALDKADNFHVRLAQLIAEGSGVSTDMVFRAG